MHKDLTTLFTGRNATFLREVDSTNSFIARALKNERLPEGASVMASVQNAGRGQAGSHWESMEGRNLLVSFVFYPSFVGPKDVFLLNKTFALAVSDLITHLTKEEIRIKWPNDIYRKDLKVAGILIENSVSSVSISHCILGIGVNVNQKEFSPSVPNPVSLSIILGREMEIEDVYVLLCSFIEARYLQLRNGEREKIESEYNNSLYALGQWRRFKSATDTFEGRILSVDENGRLVVEDRNGQLRLFQAKEVSFANLI